MYGTDNITFDIIKFINFLKTNIREMMIIKWFLLRQNKHSTKYSKTVLKFVPKYFGQCTPSSGEKSIDPGRYGSHYIKRKFHPITGHEGPEGE